MLITAEVILQLEASTFNKLVPPVIETDSHEEEFLSDIDFILVLFIFIATASELSRIIPPSEAFPRTFQLFQL